MRDDLSLFVAHYSRNHQVTPGYVKRLLALLDEPEELNDLLTSTKDAELCEHIGYLCDSRSRESQALASFISVKHMTALRKYYAAWQKQGINFDQYINPFYRFEKISNSQGRESMLAFPYHDKQDFTVNPKLLAQLDLASCPETTPEGKAVWLYTKLCNLLKYDERNFYRQKRDNANGDAFKSFDLVGAVTTDTPTTCFNFSRIAVKLLNQIKGVNATLIALGTNFGHFRFGFYTDKVSVDAEPLTPINGYNDLARVKLGIPPSGLRAIYGEALMQELVEQVAVPMVNENKQDLQAYLQALRAIPSDEKHIQIDIKELLAELKGSGVDGASTVQLLINMNRQFAQRPYKLARVGKVSDNGVLPQLLVREDDNISQIDLDDLSIAPLPKQELTTALSNATMIYVDGREDLGGLEK